MRKKVDGNLSMLLLENALAMWRGRCGVTFPLTAPGVGAALRMVGPRGGRLCVSLRVFRGRWIGPRAVVAQGTNRGGTEENGGIRPHGRDGKASSHGGGARGVAPTRGATKRTRCVVGGGAGESFLKLERTGRGAVRLAWSLFPAPKASLTTSKNLYSNY